MATGTGLAFDWQTRINSAAAWVAAPIQYVYTNGSNGSRYQFPGSAFPDGQQFRVQITSSICSATVYSQTAILTLRQAPTITIQPVSQTFCTTTAVTFSVSATSNITGYGPQYDWQYLDGSLWISASGNGVAGQGTNQLTVSGAQVVEGRKFRVVVGDGYGYNCLVTTSDEVTLIKGTPVVVTSQPLSQTVLPNSPVSFVVSATGTTGTVLYQWESRANATDTWTALTNNTDVSGVTTATLTVSYNQQSDERQFRVRLSSTACSTPGYSDVVTLTIKTSDLAVKNVTSDRTTVGSNDVVTVSWSIANDGTASSPIDWSERIYLQSPAGANRTLIKQVSFANSNSLASNQSVPRSETLTIPAQLLIDDQAVFVVEVIPGSSIHEAPGAQANNIGIQQSAWTIKKELSLALSASELTEGNTNGITATVSRTGPLASSLTVTVGISNPSRFSYPTFVVIPAGQSGVSFALSVPDNTTIEGKLTYQLQVSAAGYQGTQADVVVLDNDTPSLAIVNLPASTTEGQTVTFTVMTNLAPANPLTVFLQSSSPARFPIPASVTIPAGSLSAVVSVTLVQNTIPEIDLAVTITAGASNHNPASDTIQVKDDDLPNLELVILASSISESAGVNAAQAVLRRTASSSSIAFTANLSASLPNTLLLPGAISLAEGENEKTFIIGAVDNALVDGQRLVTVTASLFVSSCGCNAPSTSSGSVSATVTVNDDDGPSLKLTVSQQTVLEGLANAGSLRITRNSSTTAALSVTLTSSDLTEATLPATAIIPAGQAFVDVPITTIDDGIADGNQTVYFTATASGFSSGSTFVVVTDLNKPDLQIPLVELSSNKVQAGSDITYQVSVKNSGSVTAPGGTLVRGYLSIDNVIDASDVRLSEDVLAEAIPAGQTKIIAKSVKAPGTQGSYKLLFWANPDATLTELLLTNNVSTPVSITIEPNYTATAIVGPTYFLQGNNVPITGSATKLNGSPAANVPVEVYLITQGIRRTLLDTTDASGNYSIAFTPSVGESGHYSLGASAPGSNQTTVQDEFDILGVRINDGNIPRFELVQNTPVSGVLKVQNLSNKNLAGFTIRPIGLPGGVSMQFGIIAQLGGNATADLSYQIVGSTLSTGDNFNVVNFEATANEGVIQKQKLYYYCQAPNAFVVANVTSFETAVSQASKERIVEIKLLNKGKGATGNVTVNLPSGNWITSVTPKILPSITAGDSSLVTLRFLALDEVPFDLPINSSIGVVAQNGNSFTIPFTFRKVAEAKGSASITATDQFTYFADGHPNVAGARVRIENYFTGELYAEGMTDASGVFNVTGVPEGKHRVIAEKEKHKSYDGTIIINPGSQSQSTAFLEYQAVTYTWKVVPTTVQDQYDIKLETKFETNIPMPVVTIDMPNSVPQLSAGQQYSFMVTLINHGLITAKDVVLNLPKDDPEYEFLTNYITADLLAQQSIQVSVVMRRRSGSGRIGFDGGRTTANTTGGPCQGAAGVNYWYECAAKAIGVSTATLVKFLGRCNNTPNNESVVWTDEDIIRFINQYNYWASIAIAWSEAFRGVFDGGTVGGGPKGTPKPYELPKWMTEKKSCDQCINDAKEAIAGCRQKTFKAYEYCNKGVKLNHGGTNDYVKCIADAALGKVPYIGQFICLKNIINAVNTCSKIEPNSKQTRNVRVLNNVNNAVSAAFKEIAANLEMVATAYNIRANWSTEYFSDLSVSEAWSTFYPLIDQYIETLTVIPLNAQGDIINAMNDYDIPSATIKTFFVRWNMSIQARNNNILSPNTQFPDIINWNLVKAYSDSLVDIHNYSIDRGFQSIDGMDNESMNSLNEIIDGQKDDVCASVSVQFNQQLTMTREAFEGTLEVTNGHPTDAMKTISVNIQITDENGTPSNGLFEIQPQSATSLADINAGQSGSVKFIFIPEVGAAPQVSKIYKFGGSISYLDPYAKAVVTLPLAAVPITVNPSPNLMLHYFMERNILGDDALTSPEIEPSVPAELAVMVENKGYGPARDMTISSAQPKIVDNEKGLAINFNLIGSNLQGQPKQLGISNINFGEIPAQQTRIGQWYFTSSLLGKFVSYDAKVVHNSSFGNKDLSLIQGVKLHELTKGIRLYGDLEDGITDFLVNDIFDVNDQPDIIYFSQGNRTAKVSPATSGSFSAPVSGPTFTNTLTVTPSEAGFNYIKLPDPGNRLYELVSVTRNDGQVIPLNNAWLTFVTLPVSRSPIYENKFHIVDNFASSTSASYTVVWKPKDINVPKVDSIAGAPTQVASMQVKKLKVYFNKRIDPATFTYHDLTLTLQGGQNVINSSVIITQLDTASFNIDLSAITTGNGLYVFTAQAAAVKDLYGVSGTGGKQVSWTQFLNGISITGLKDSYCSNATSQTLIGVPSGGIFSGPGITGNVFDPAVAGAGSHIITYSKDGKSIADTTKVNPVPSISIRPGSTTLTCASPTLSLSAIGADSLRWSTGAISSIISVSAVGVYSVTALTSSGCSAVASTTVTSDATLSLITLASNGPLSCSAASVTLTAGGAGAGASYTFSTGATQVGNTNMATVATAGVYSVTARSASGCSAVASTTVTGDATIPVVTLTNNGPLSCTATNVTLTAGGLGAGASYTFSTGATQVGSGSTATVSTSGVYSVTGISGSGCTAVTSTTVAADQNVPSTTLDNNGPLSCTMTSVTLTAGGGGSGASYHFSSGATQTGNGPIATVSVAGVYSVTVISSSGCSVITSTTVTSISGVALAGINPQSATLTCATPTMSLTASGGVSYHWEDGSVNAVRPVSTTGIYSVTVTTAMGCTALASTTIVGGPSVVLASISPSSATLTCTSPTVSLTASGGVSYRWEDNSTNPVRPVSTTGLYSVTVTAASGCTALASTTVVGGSNIVQANISPSSATLTCASPVISLTASGGNSYKWEDGSVNTVRPVSTTGTYSVTVTTGTGCTATASTTIGQDQNAPPAKITASSATLTCATPTVSLTASGGVSYRWDDNSVDAVRPISTTGTYSVTVTAANGCTAIVRATIDRDKTLPTASISPRSATLTCATPTVSLTASGGVSYRWEDGSVSTVRPVSTTGIYSVTVTGASGCTAVASTTVVSGLSAVFASISPSSATLTCTSPTLSLTASGGTTYRWEDGSTSAVRPVSTTGLYSVTVTSASGCTAVATSTISKEVYEAPGIFTQNGHTYPGGVSSLTVSQDTGPVILTVSGCTGGTIIWAGNDATTLTVLTTTTGTFTYSAICRTNGCDSPVGIASVTVVPTMLRILHREATNNDLFTTAIKPYLILDNIGSGPISYSAITVRYWLTVEESIAITRFSVYNAPFGANNVHLSYTPLTPGRSGATAYLEYRFDAQAGSLAPLTNSGPIENGFSKDNYSAFNQADDYSYVLNRDYAPNAHITAYSNGVLVWGQEPAALITTSVPLAVSASAISTLNPTTATLVANARGGSGTYSYAFSGPGTLSANGNTAVASNLPAGVQTFTVVVVDTSVPTAQTVTATMSVTVISVAISPLKLTLSATPATLRTTGIVTLSATASGGTPGYRYIFSGPGSLSTVGSTASVSGLTVGVHTFTVVVSDVALPTSQSVTATVSVTVNNAQPIPSTNSSQTATVGVDFTYTVQAFSNPETPGSLTYTATISPANNFSFNPATRLISGIPSMTGVSTVTITATEAGGLSASTTFTIGVNPAGVFVPASLRVLHRDAGNGQLNTNAIYPYFILDNLGSQAIPYDQITVRYWLTVENPAPVTNLPVYSAEIGAVNVHPVYVPLASALAGATGYVEYSFGTGSGNLIGGTNSGGINTAISKQDYSAFNQADDYSYVFSRDFIPNNHITAYRNGNLVWGIEPIGVGTPAPGNTAPVATANANQSATQGVPFAYTVNAFTDDQTPNSLTYSASISPANSLTFNAATRTISGTPDTLGESSVIITVTDPDGLSASTSFTITTNPPLVAPTVHLQVLHRDASNGQLNTNAIYPYFILDNLGDQPLNYGQLTVRYWLTVENPAPVTNLPVYGAQIGASNVHPVYVPLIRENATGYVEYSFSAGAGSLSGKNNSGSINTAISKQDYSAFDQSNDYSYVFNRDFAPNGHFTAYYDGRLVWGNEPAVNARLAAPEVDVAWRVEVLGNPVEGSELVVQVTGAGGQPLRFRVTDVSGHLIDERYVEQADTVEQQRMSCRLMATGLLLIQVSTPKQTQTIKVLKIN